MSKPRLDNFDDLLARTRSGDEAALAQLIDTCTPQIRRIARAMLGPLLRRHVDTVDVAQSVHLAIFTGVREGKLDVSDPDRLIGLAATLVRRKIANHWQKIKRRREISPRQLHPNDLLALSSSACSTESEEPASIVAHEDQMRHLLDQLNETERKLIELRLLGHSTAEVARKLDMDAGVLRVYLGRLRKRLREADQSCEWL